MKCMLICILMIGKRISLASFRKDVNAFFSYPVTDSIAPGYSSIIKEPMDFSTMKSKIDNNEYKSIIEYRVSIICNH